MFKNLIEELRPRYDKIIIDTPPTSLVADTYMIAPLVDINLIVLHYGHHSMEAIQESLQNLNRYSDKPKAFVLNHCEHGHGYGYGYGYGYGHYGHYGYYGKDKKDKKKKS
jgi:tyrosine-protein kinase Etk/Wzc